MRLRTTVETFYKGKNLTSVVPFGPGGGYATYSQIMARHFGKFVPGQPQIVLQFRPGAGGIVASNYLYNAAPRDGSVMAMVSDSVALASVIDADKTKYKVNEFIWLGAIERVNNVLAVRADTGVREVRDMLKTEVIVGSSGAGSPDGPAAGAAALARSLQDQDDRRFLRHQPDVPRDRAQRDFRRDRELDDLQDLAQAMVRDRLRGADRPVRQRQGKGFAQRAAGGRPCSHAGTESGRALHGLQCRRRTVVHRAAGCAGGAGGGAARRIRPDGEGSGLHRRHHQGRIRPEPGDRRWRCRRRWRRPPSSTPSSPKSSSDTISRAK